MLVNRDILIIAQPSWEGDYMKAVVELAKRMAEGNRVLYVQAPDTFHRGDTQTTGLHEEPVKNGKLYFYVPSPVIPVNALPDGSFYDMMNHINNSLLLHQLDKVVKDLNFKNPILINGLSPFYGNQILGRYHESSSTYFCYDDITGREWNKRHGVRLEQEMLPRYDLTVCTSKELLKVKGNNSKHTTVVHNGVDSSLFGAIEHQKEKETPRIGFIGSIDERIDLTMIYEAAKQKPKWEFCIVGRITVDISELESLPNVVFTGAKQPHELPHYLETFDAGLIPFVKDRFTKSIYPIKVNEYLCAGIPVISTPFSYDILGFSDCIEIIETPQQLISAGTKAVQGNWKCSEYEMKQRGKLADWSVRANQFLTEIEMIEQSGLR